MTNLRFELSRLALAGFAMFAVAPTMSQMAPNGKEIFEKSCAACHATGAAGAPKLGDAQEWKTRSSRGAGALFLSAFQGKNAMPPRGGNAALSNVEVEAAVVYLVSQSLGLSPEKVAKLPAQTAAASPTSQPASKPARSTEAKPDAAAKPAAIEPKTAATPADLASGKNVYQATCATCHASGLAGAPKVGDTSAWEPRVAAGKPALYQSALKGKNAMPAKGGNLALGEMEVKAAVDFMVAQLKTVTAQKSPSTAPQPAAPAQSTVTTVAASSASTAESGSGKATYEANCAACHATGLAGAPKFGDKAAWDSRIAAGAAKLLESAIKGKNAMPAKGGNAALSDNDVKAAVDFMIAKAGRAERDKTDKADKGESTKQAASVRSATAAQSDAPDAAKSGAGNAKDARKDAALNDSTATSPVVLADTSAKTPTDAVGAQNPAITAPPGNVSTPTRPVGTAAADPNAFNRLLKPAGKRNLPAPESGIHDPTNDGTHMLQPPLQAFGNLPRSPAGNQIDWVKALNEAKINPRMDKTDASVEPLVLDMNIVREVKGSMPDVVYPHKQHTQWLDCSNCHPAIFIPQKGANQISMAAILLGQKCGVCHGKVAFPVSECRLCHSKNKEPKTAEKTP